MRSVLEPKVPVEALAPDAQVNRNDLVLIATDGLATGTREASRISVLNTPALIVWFRVGVLAALAAPLLAIPITTVRDTENRILNTLLFESFFMPTTKP